MDKIYRKKSLDGKHETFSIRVQIDGRRRMHSLGVDIGMPEARKRERKMLRQLHDERLGYCDNPNMTFGEYLKQYLERMEYKKSMDRIVQTLNIYLAVFGWGNTPIRRITPAMIEMAKKRRLEEFGRAPSTVVKELQMLGALFRTAVDNGVLFRSPAARVKLPTVHNQRNRVLTPDEFGRLVRAVGAKSDKALQRMRMAYFTGGRWGEIDRVLWQDVDYQTGFITWRDTKTGMTNQSAITPQVRAILESLPQPLNRSQPVFPPVRPVCPSHSRFHAEMIKCRSCYNMFHKKHWTPALATAKITDFHFHDLRHQACTDLANDGRPQADLKAFCRHASISMTARYTHLSDNRQRETAASLSDTPAGQALGTMAPNRHPAIQKKSASRRK